MAAEVLLLDEPGEPLSVYLRSVLSTAGVLGDGKDGLVLSRLTGEVICQVHAGVCHSETARKVLEALLAGQRVWTPWEGLSHLGRGPLARLTAQRLWDLRRSGLVLCPLGELAAWVKMGKERGYGVGPGPGFGLVYQKIQ